MIDLGKIFYFVLAVMLVMFGLWVGMQIYMKLTGYQAPVWDEGEEIIDDKLRKMSQWRTYYLTNFKFVKKDSGIFHLIVEFNFNNFPQLLKMIAETKNTRLRQKSDISLFNYIVDMSDNSTAPEDPLEPKVVGPHELEQIDDFTKQVLGIRDSVQAEEKAPGADNPEIQDLFKFLDMLESDINLRDRLRVQISDRILTMKIPLLMVGKDPEKTMLRFDPNYFIGSTTISNNMLEVWVYDEKMVVFSASNPDKQMIVPLEIN